MDLLSLGARSRRTGLTPKENLKRDKYDMEDVDAFFEDDDKGYEGSTGKRNSVNSQILHRSISSGSSALSETPKQRDSFNNVARKIDFTEAEAERFRLSVVSMSDRSSKKSNKRLPLRSPLHESSKGRTTQFDVDEYDFQEDNFDFNNGNEATLSPIPIPNIDSSEAGSPIPQISTRKTKSLQAPKAKRGPAKKAASLTKQMALGSNASTKNQKAAKLDFSLSEFESEPSADIISPPPTAKRIANDKPVALVETIVRPTPLPSPPPDGLRRSRRTKIAPLAYWRNERIVYTRADEFEDNDNKLVDDIHNIPLQEIKEVVHIPERAGSNTLSRRPLRSRNGRVNKPRTNRRRPARSAVSGSNSEGSEWLNDKNLSLEVYESPDSDARQVRRVAWAPQAETYRDHLIESDDPEVAENFKVATLFDQDRDFIACAMLELPVDGFKLLRSSAGSVYIFHMVEGDVEVTLNELTFVVTRGCSFQVPRANVYGFRNVGSEVATLFFVQSQPHLGENPTDGEDSE